jgi:hypothetical protein
MTLLALLLAINAVLHAMVVIRFGARDNLPYLLFVFVYGALAIAVYLLVPYVLWAVLVLSLLGLLGLTLTLGKLKARQEARPRDLAARYRHHRLHRLASLRRPGRLIRRKFLTPGGFPLTSTPIRRA